MKGLKKSKSQKWEKGQMLNDISCEAIGPIKPKCHLWQPWAGGLKVCVFYENRHLSLVAMAT